MEFETLLIKISKLLTRMITNALFSSFFLPFWSRSQYNIAMVFFYVCLCRACIVIGGFLMLSGCAVLSKAVFMLVDDNERKRVRNYLGPARAIVWLSGSLTKVRHFGRAVGRRLRRVWCPQLSWKTFSMQDWFAYLLQAKTICPSGWSLSFDTKRNTNNYMPFKIPCWATWF